MNRKTTISVLVAGMMMASVPAFAGECVYVAFPDGSDSVDIESGELGANAGCGIAQLIGINGACLQNYRDSSTGEPCIPDEYSTDDEGDDDEGEEDSGDTSSGSGGSGGTTDYGGGFPSLGPDGCVGDGCSGTVTVGELEQV